MKVILLNGPPRSGKDVAGRMIAQMMPGRVVLCKFAHVLKMATHAVMTMLHGTGQVKEADAYEATKDEAHEDFYGCTPREAYIAMSEEYCKPLFGEGFFGEVMANNILQLTKKDNPPDTVIITDCGFFAEVEVLVDCLGTEADFHLIRVQRKGADYEGDSRGDINVPELTTHVLNNSGYIGELRVAVAELLLRLEL